MRNWEPRLCRTGKGLCPVTQGDLSLQGNQRERSGKKRCEGSIRGKAGRDRWRRRGQEGRGGEGKVKEEGVEGRSGGRSPKCLVSGPLLVSWGQVAGPPGTPLGCSPTWVSLPQSLSVNNCAVCRPFCRVQNSSL